MPRSTDVLALTNGKTTWEINTLTADCDVVWQEQTSSWVLVFNSKEQVSRYEATVRRSKTQLSSYFTSSRVEELYRFLNAWVPQLYGELDEEAIKTRGFELIQHDTEWMNNRTSSKVSKNANYFSISHHDSHILQDGADFGDEIGEYTRESWEVSRLISINLSQNIPLISNKEYL